MAYGDITLLKRVLDVEPANADDDDLLDFYLAVAQVSIDHACLQSFEAAEDATRYFSPARFCNGGAVDGRDLILDAPLCQITSVVNGDGVTLDASSYITVPINGARWYCLRMKDSSGLAWTYDSDIESDLIAITGRWAYSLTADETIQQVTMRMAAYLYKQRDNALDLDRAIQTQGGIVLPVTLPKDIETLLMRGGYMRIGVD